MFMEPRGIFKEKLRSIKEPKRIIEKPLNCCKEPLGYFKEAINSHKAPQKIPEETQMFFKEPKGNLKEALKSTLEVVQPKLKNVMEPTKILRKLLNLQSDPSIPIISIALNDLADTFFISKNLNYNIVRLNDLTASTESMINHFMSKMFQKSSLSSILLALDLIELEIIENPSFFIAESLRDMVELSLSTELIHIDDDPKINFIFIPKLTLEELNSTLNTQLRPYKKLNLFQQGMITNGLFVINELDSILLVSVEWFTQVKCNEAHLKVLNRFHKKSMTWKLKLESYEKFKNYHGCELVLMLPLAQDNGKNPEHAMGKVFEVFHS